MIIIGITGSIGCGKTTLSKQAKSLGFPVWDIDGWVRSVYRDKDFIRLVNREFFNLDSDKAVDKRALRSLVFNDYQQLKKLEQLIHPFLQRRLRRLINKTARRKGLVIIDAALLFELNWNRYCDYVIVADVAYEVQKKRVMARDHISAEEFEKINARQMPNAEKVLKADVVIDTNKPENVLRASLALLFEELMNG